MWRQFHRTTPLHVDTAPQDDTITYGGPQFLRREFHGTLPFHVDDPHDMWRDFHGTMPLSVDDPISLAGSSGGFEPSLWSWPWKQQSNFLHKALLLMMMYHPIIFGWKKISSSADMEKQSYLIKRTLTVTLNLKTANQPSCITLRPMMLHHHTKFGYRRFSSWGDIVQMNIHWNSEPFLWPWPWPQQSNQIFSQDYLLMMMYH